MAMESFNPSRLAIAVLSLMTLSAALLGQTPSPTPDAVDRPVKISTSLVQLDVLVTGKDGRPVTGLTADDFMIFQDEKPQKISAVIYVDEKSASRTTLFKASVTKEERKIGTPPSNVRSRQGRIITFVLDDGNCLATVVGTAGMRDAIRRFIDTQMESDDRVAIYRTAGGANLLQAYTSNKEVLRRFANKVNFLPSRGCGSTFEAARDQSTIKFTGKGAKSFESEVDKAARIERETSERRNQVVGTIGVLNFVVDRLSGAPQRKTIFLLSEGVIANIKDDTFDRLRELADKAARSSVVIHTMSSKGVSVPGMISAQDEVLPLQTEDLAVARRDEERSLNEGLAYLAAETGGRFVRNSNRLETEVRRTLDAQAGYYLISYEPDVETFRGKAFHRIEVKIGKPDLAVSSRRGFYGRTDSDNRPVYRTPDSPLFQAISSPFSETGLDVRLTLITENNHESGDYVRALFTVPGEDLALASDRNGKKASFDVVAVITDEKGKVIEEFNRTYPIAVPEQGIATVERNGLDFMTDVPIKKPGVYTFRIAVRNNNSKLIGSAGDVFEIPDDNGSGLSLSRLVTTTVLPNGTPMLPVTRSVNAAFAPVLDQGTVSVRRYVKNSVLAYVYHVRNARMAAGTQKPDLTRAIRLFKDGNEIVAVRETPLTRAQSADFDDFGTLRITDAVEVGEYVLQVIIRDKIANKVSSQWIDFEVTN